MARAVLFDLDDTLVDTSSLRDLRTARRWKDAVGLLSRTAIFPGVPELIAALAAARVPWAVITTSVSFYAGRVLSHHGLTPATLVAYHDAIPKPHPAGVSLALSRLGVAASEVVGIGDADTDLAAYRAAGVVALGAGWSPACADCGWDGLVETPGELLARVGVGR